MNEQNGRHYHPLSLFFSMYEWLIPVCVIPALTVMVFLRTKLGYRFVNSVMVSMALLAFGFFGAFGGLVGTPLNSHFEEGLGARYGAQTLFCILVIALSIYHRRRGWKLIFDQDNPWHTQSRGLSWLSYILPVDSFIIQRYIEPALCGVIGFVLMLCGFSFLGMWLMFAGLALAAVEQLVFETALNAMLDRHDIRALARQVKLEDDLIRSGGNVRQTRVEENCGFRATVSPEVGRLLMESQTAPEAPEATAAPLAA